MDKNLGDRIRGARNRAGITQKSLAKKLSIAYPTLNKYERGHRIPDAELLNRIAKELNCDPGWLLTGEGQMERAIYNKVEEGAKKPLPVAEEPAIYNKDKRDPELDEIVDILKHDLPEAKKAVLKILKGAKEAKEGYESIVSIKKPTKEEG